MPHRWSPRCPPPRGLVVPVGVDPTGRTGPTKGQAAGPGWRRSSPRRYVPAATDRSVVEQRILEEAQRLPPGGLVTGWAALRLAGGGFFDGLDPRSMRELPVPLLVPPGLKLRRGDGCTVARERIETAEVTSRHGIPCATSTRAVFDAAVRATDLREAVVVVDMALVAGLVTLPELRRFTVRKCGWPRVRTMRAALELADPRSRSPQETRMRLIWVLDAAYPRPRCNWPVADDDGHRIGKPDLLCTELATYGEYDGDDHGDRRRRRSDARRHDGFGRVGLHGFVVVGEDLEDIPLVLDRMRSTVRRAELSSTARSWRLLREPGPP